MVYSRGIVNGALAQLTSEWNVHEDQEMYFINGTMEEILENLCKIRDLRVVSRNSVEQYRDNPKPTPEIAEENNML